MAGGSQNGINVESDEFSLLQGTLHGRNDPSLVNETEGFASHSMPNPTANPAANLVRGCPNPMDAKKESILLSKESSPIAVLTQLFDIYDLSDDEQDGRVDENGNPWSAKRQGRSRKVREQKRREKELADMIRRPAPAPKCVNTACATLVNPMKPFTLVEDHGDLICEECGAVNRERMVEGDRPGPVTENFVSYRPVRYQSFVHFGVRFRQLERRDPSIDPDYILILRDFLQENEEKMEKNFGPATFWGPKTFRRIFEFPDLKAYSDKVTWRRTMSRHWLQIRGRLNIEPFRIEIPSDIGKMACERYKLVYKAFEQLRRDPTSIHFGKKNIFSINYIYLQIMRCESEEVAKRVAMFLPQTLNTHQPGWNNRRWEEIVDYISCNFGPGSLFKGETLDSFHGFAWNCELLTEEYILRHCCFFK